MVSKEQAPASFRLGYCWLVDGMRTLELSLFSRSRPWSSLGQLPPVSALLQQVPAHWLLGRVLLPLTLSSDVVDKQELEDHVQEMI